MEPEILKRRFFEIVSPSLPNEWDVEDVVSQLLELPEESVETLFEQIAVIWPVSHSLCFAYLVDGVKFAGCIPREHIAEWSRQILSLYETGGLVAARKFMADPEKLFLAPMQGISGVEFSEVSEQMQLYLHGVSGGEVGLSVANVPQTDTKSIYVPGGIHVFPTQAENRFLYKFIISLQWGHITSRVFEHYLDQKHGGVVSSISGFNRYPDAQKAKDLFSVLQFILSLWLLEDILPGLVGRSRTACRGLVDNITTSKGPKAYSAVLKAILRFSISEVVERDKNSSRLEERWLSCISRLQRESALDVFPEFYSLLNGVEGGVDF